MHVLVTGATGFLGRAVCDALRPSAKVTGLGFRHEQDSIWPVDLRNLNDFASVLTDAAPDWVVHCAAYRDPDFCEMNQEETQRLNVMPVRTLVDTLPGTARVLFISTDYVFSGEHAPYREGDQRNPVNFYGQSKREAEDIALERGDSLILRIPLLVGDGPDFDGSGFIAKTIKTLESGQEVEVDNKTMRYPTDIRDVAEAVLHLIDARATGIFHYSGKEGRTQYEWSKAIGEQVGLDTAALIPVSEPAARKAMRPGNTQLLTDKIEATGFSRFTSFAQVIQRVCALRQR